MPVWNEHVGLGNRILRKRRAVRSQLTRKIELRAERDQDEKENIEKLKTKELRARLASLRLETTRKKAELRARLQAAVENNDTSSEEERDDDVESEGDKKNMGECNQKARVVSTLSFKDVVGALE